MRVYRIDYQVTYGNTTEGANLKWVGTQKDVAAFKRWIREDPDTELEAVFECDIPMNKAGLLEWLNDNFNSDRG